VDPKRSSRLAASGPIPQRVSSVVAGAVKGPLAGTGALRPGAVPLPAQTRGRGPALGEVLDQLSQDLRQLQVDFERFFNGALPFPPDELRTRIQNQIRGLRNLTQTSAVDSFRLGDLEARFNSYNELFNRRVRDREEGRRQVAHHGAPKETPRYDPAAGIVFGAAVEPAAVEALYQGLAGQGDGPKFDLDSFQTYLARQVAALREKTGCAEVQFRLANEDGKLKLKARPVPARSSQQ
jgi:hypothetical protein